MFEVPLSRGKVAIVDAVDYEVVMALAPWHCLNKGYAIKHKHVGMLNGRRIRVGILLHRFIAERMGLDMTMEIDHKNRDKLDCRRCNLRTATDSQQAANKMRKSSSGFKGVDKRNSKWRAKIKTPEGVRYLGVHDTPEKAARAYDRVAREVHGEYARTNFPD